MKKTILLLITIGLVIIGLTHNLTAQDGNKNQENRQSHSAVTKTYTLQHLSPQEVERTLRQYFLNCSYSPNGNMISVTIFEYNVPRFEELLAKLDVERKKILVRVFTVIASHQGNDNTTEIDNQEIKSVLAELKKVLSFKSFKVDGVSAVTLTDRQHISRLALSSQFPLRLELGDISIREDSKGKKSITFEFSLGQKAAATNKDGNWFYDTIIESETSVKEKGYLVAGVSKIGKNGDSLVLIINAEIIQ